MSRKAIISPSEIQFAVDNHDATYSRSDFEGEECLVTLAINHVPTRQWRFVVRAAVPAYGKIKLHCVDLLQEYIVGDYPLTKHPREVFPHLVNDPANENLDDYRIPKIFGKAYIPVMWVYDDSVSEGYYVLGTDSDYSITNVKAPPEYSKNTYSSDSYTFTQTTTSELRLAQFYVSLQNDGSYDDGMWPSHMRPLVEYEKASGSTTDPTDILADILAEIGISANRVDLTDSWVVAATNYTSFGITWNGGFYRAEARERVLNSLLTQADSMFYSGEKIELRMFDATVKETFDTSKIKKLSFRPSRRTKTGHDSGHVSWAVDGHPQNSLPGKALVPVGSTTANPDSEIFSCPFINDSELAQDLGTLYFRRKLTAKDTVSFDSSGDKLSNLDSLKPGDVIQLDGTLYGDTRYLIIKSLTIKKDLTVSISGDTYDSVQDLSSIASTPVAVSTDDISPTFPMPTYGATFGVDVSGGGTSENQVSDDGYVTAINADIITAGSLTSSNWDAANGTRLNLLTGQMEFGGSVSPTITIDSTVPAILMGLATGYMAGTGDGSFQGKSGGTFKYHVGNPSGSYMSYADGVLTVSDAIYTGSLIADTTANTFTINSDRADATVKLIFGHSPGGDAEISWNGSVATLNKNTAFAGDVSIAGNLTVLGTEFIADVEIVQIKDNLAIINYGETGAGVTAGFAGWEADRGTLTNYKWGFDETTDTWRVGEDGSLQAIATRSDSPNALGLAYWNDTAKRLDTLSSVTVSAGGKITAVDLNLTTPSDVYNLDHDSFSGFVSNEHINHAGVTITAGDGLTGGGTIAATRTLAMGTPSTLTNATVNGVTATSHTHAITNYAVSGTVNQVTVTGAGKVLGSAITLSLPQNIHTGASPTFADLTISTPSAIYSLNHDSFSGFVVNEHIDHTSVTLTAGNGLLNTGTGDISASRTFTLGTPGTLTNATTNGVTTESHTHAITNYALSGTANQVTVTGAGKLLGEAATLSLPQDIDTGATPTFTSLTLSQATGSAPLAISSTTKVANLNADTVDGVNVASLTNGRLTRYNSTGTQIENATVTESAGALGGITTLNMSGQLTNTLAIGTAPFVVTSTTRNVNLNADLWDGYEFDDYLNQAVKTDSSPVFVTAKLSALTDGYLPYHVSDAAGLANGPLYTNGTNIGLGTTDLAEIFNIAGNIALDGDLGFIGAQSITTSSGNLTLSPADNLDITTIAEHNYVSGILGIGWRIDPDTTGGSFFEVDNMRIRHTLRTHVFKKDIVKASNGILYISDSAEIAADCTVNADNTTTLTNNVIRIKKGEGNATFSVDDTVWFKDITDGGGTINSVKFDIASVYDDTNSDYDEYTVKNVTAAGNLIDGGTLVRISGPHILLDASSTYAPFIDWYNDTTLYARIGNLNGIHGYSTETYGAVFGDTGSDYLTIDPTNGIRFLDSSDAVQAQLAFGKWTIGEVDSGKSNVQITAGKVSLRNNTIDNIVLDTDGSGFIAGGDLSWDVSGNIDMTGTITITGGSGISNLTDAGDLATADDLDDVSDGITYGRVNVTAISDGNILLTSCVGDLDDIADGTYGKVLSTDISAGHILLSETTGDLDDIADGTTYGRVNALDLSANRISISSSSISDVSTGADNTAANETFSSENDIDYDAIPNGTTYGKILLTDISAGHILLSESIGDIDDITDGTTYARVSVLDLSSNRISITSSAISDVGANADNTALNETFSSESDIDFDSIPDGVNYGKILNTDISAGHIVLSTTIGDLDDITDGTIYGRPQQTILDSGYVKLLRDSSGESQKIEITASGIDLYQNDAKLMALESDALKIYSPQSEATLVTADGDTIVTTDGDTLVAETDQRAEYGESMWVGAGATQERLEWNTTDGLFIADPDGTKVFQITPAGVTTFSGAIDGATAGGFTLIDGGYLNTDVIEAASIAVEKLSVSTLSSITADIGTVTAGILRSSDSGTYLDLDNEQLYFNGKSSFDSTTNGIFIGYDTDDYKVNIGDASSYFKYDGAFDISLASGDSFDLAGDLNVLSGGNIALTGGDTTENKGILKVGASIEMGASVTTGDFGVWSDDDSLMYVIGGEPTTGGGVDLTPFGYIHLNAKNTTNGYITLDSKALIWNKVDGTLILKISGDGTETIGHSKVSGNIYTGGTLRMSSAGFLSSVTNTNWDAAYTDTSEATSAATANKLMKRNANADVSVRYLNSTRVGIGTSSPGFNLEIIDNAASAVGMMLKNSLSTSLTAPSIDFKTAATGYTDYAVRLEAQVSRLGVFFTDDDWSTETKGVEFYANSTLFNGSIDLKEMGTSPSTFSGYGRLYTKSDNKLYFKDGDGTEHEVAFI
jgi:hypothetical protein